VLPHDHHSVQVYLYLQRSAYENEKKKYGHMACTWTDCGVLGLTVEYATVCSKSVKEFLLKTVQAMHPSLALSSRAADLKA